MAIFLDANYLFYNLLAKDLESLSVMATHSVELLNNLITIMISFLVSKVSMQEFLIGKVDGNRLYLFRLQIVGVGLFTGLFYCSVKSPPPPLYEKKMVVIGLTIEKSPPFESSSF